MAHQATGLGPTARILVLAGQPEKALGAQQFAVDPRAVDKVEEALRMKRTAGPIGGGSDAVLFGFRHMLAAQFLQPAWGLGGAFEVETPGVEDLVQRHFAHDHRDDLRLGIQAFEDGHQFLTFVAADQVDLADQDDVGELDLLDQQVGDRALIFFAQGFATEARLSAAW
jgi:hypothetical protein